MAPVNRTAGTFAGAVARGRQQAYNALTDAVEQSDRPQNQIAQDAGISPEHLSRLLARPRNVEIDTLARLVLSACGGALAMSLAFPTYQVEARDTVTTIRGDSFDANIKPTATGTAAILTDAA